MSVTSDDLMNVARAAAERVDLSQEIRLFPSFSDVEEQCEPEFDELLGLLHDDEVFEPVSVERQEELVGTLQAAIPENAHALLDELIDNLSRQIWLNQEAAFHLGMAVGMRIAEARRH